VRIIITRLAPGCEASLKGCPQGAYNRVAADTYHSPLPNPVKPASGSMTPGAPPVTPGAVTRADPPALARKLGLFDVTMLVMGTVIGTGIFVVPHDVASLVGSPSLVLLAWACGGVFSMAGGLVYAELTRTRPNVGGQYAYLRDAYHPAVAFVYGWSLLWIIQSGGLASVAVVFGRYFIELTRFLADWTGRLGNLDFLAQPLGAFAESSFSSPLVTTVAIGSLTLVNCAGVRTGSTAQNIFMTLKVLAIVMLVTCGLCFVKDQRSTQAVDTSTISASWQTCAAFAAAMVPVLFSYGGWHTTTFVAGEVREPARNLPRGLILGVAGVIALYVAVNFVCLRVLGVDQLAKTKHPASEVMQQTVGPNGAALISVGIAISALGFLSQGTLTSPRVYYAMAEDGLFFKAVARVHPRTRAPVVAILLQGLFAAVISLSATFQQIINYVMSVEMIFLALTGMSLFIFRRRERENIEAGGSSGHPVTTILFAIVNVILVLDLLYEYPANSAIGIGIALAGVPVYFLWRSASVCRR
jgi:APA family basic amino acid/polyamine antiporter